MEKKLYHGAAYYPELWDETVIDQDIELMKQAGISVVRMGEFAWSQMEPEEGKIDLTFFGGIVDKLYANGISTIFCTPTPTPPIWITHNHPERMFVNSKGERMSHGARQQICTNNPDFLFYSDRITEAIAKKFADHPGVIAWQLDNEFKCHIAECYCEICLSLWHEWLREKYETIENLNAKWGTGVWSETYQSFEQIPQPKVAPYLHNAALSTNYRLFSYDKIAQFGARQAEIIRRYSKAPITHNGHTNFSVDNEKLFAPLDFTSFDDYPDCDNWRKMIYNYDYFRNVKQDGKFYVMETSTGHNGALNGYEIPHRTDYLRAEAAAAFAGGAMGFNYWLWRQQRSGVEQNHGHVISSWGKPSVGWNEVLKVEDMRKKFEPFFLKTKVKKAELAQTYSATARAFFMTEPLEGIDYNREMCRVHKLLLDAGLPREIISDNADLSGYKMLVTAYLPAIEKTFLRNVLAYIEAGGVWVVGPLTGFRTPDQSVPYDYALGIIELVMGFETRYFYPMKGSGAKATYKGVTAELSGFGAVFEEKDVKVLAKTEGGKTPDLPVIIEKPYGKGKIVIIGAIPKGEAGEELLSKLYADCAKDAGIAMSYSPSQGIIFYEREGEDGEYLFICDMQGDGGKIILPGLYEDVETGARFSGPTQVGAYECLLFKKIR